MPPLQIPARRSAPRPARRFAVPVSAAPGLRGGQAARAMRIAAVGLAFAGSATWSPAGAQRADDPASQAPLRRYDVPAGPLPAALNTLAEQADVLLSVPSELTRGKSSPGVRGAYTVDGAFQALLIGTGLQAMRQSDGTYALRAVPGAAATAVMPEVTVFGKPPANPESEPYAGGQVSQGAGVGLLGNRNYLETPYSVTGYTEKAVRDAQSTSVAELLTTADASVRASIDSSNRYDALTIRGFRVDNDEIAVNGLYGLVPAYRISPDPVERIEILKGPGAMLNGMLPWGSVGGSVNLATKRADDKPLSRVTAEYLSDSVFGGHADVGRRFGNDGAFGVRVNAAHRGGDTAIDRQSRSNTALSAGLDYRGERLRLYGDVIYQRDFMRAASRGYIPLPGIPMPAAPNPRINLAQPFSFSNSHSLTTMGRAEYDLSSGIRLFGAVGSNRFGYDKLEDPGATILDALGSARGTSRRQQGQSRALSAEAGARGTLKTGPVEHQWVVSANSLQQSTWFGQIGYGSYLTDLYLPTLLADPGPPSSVSALAKDSERTLRSIAIADTLSLADGAVQLTLGVRRQQVDTRNLAANGAETSRYRQGATTPSVALLVRATAQMSLYANYVEALTPGASPPPDAVNPNQVFAPFKSKQYELGAKFDFRRFGATLSLFQIDVPSGIVDPTTRVFNADGLQRHRGVELSGFGLIGRNVRVLAGTAWLDAKLARTQDGAFDGNHAIGAPAFQANLGAEWDTPFMPGFTLTGRVIHTTRAYVSQDNTQRVPAWTRADLGGRFTTRVRGKEMTLRAMVTNLFDRYYWQANPTGYVISGMPRTFWLSLSADL